MSRAVACVALALLAAGCRPDPGPSQYNNQESFDGGGASSLPGPDPYMQGDRRLSVGWNYEGGYSDVIEVDSMTSFLYIYGTLGPGMDTGSVTIQNSTDRVEGLSSQLVTCANDAYLGFGINWTVTHDLSPYQNMHVSFKSSDDNFADFVIGMNNGEDAATHTYTVHTMGAYGWVNDGQWHNLVIPIADFVATGFDPTMATAPFVLTTPGDPAGQKLLIDDLFFTAN